MLGLVDVGEGMDELGRGEESRMLFQLQFQGFVTSVALQDFGRLKWHRQAR